MSEKDTKRTKDAKTASKTTCINHVLADRYYSLLKYIKISSEDGLLSNPKASQISVRNYAWDSFKTCSSTSLMSCCCLWMPILL